MNNPFNFFSCNIVFEIVPLWQANGNIVPGYQTQWHHSVRDHGGRWRAQLTIARLHLLDVILLLCNWYVLLLLLARPVVQGLSVVFLVYWMIMRG